MYAVIFHASIKQQNQQYLDMADRLRKLALQKYNCSDFIAVTEGDQEIAISYWQSLEDIANWKNDVEHKKAQQYGKDFLYHNYQVQITKIERSYSSDMS